MSDKKPLIAKSEPSSRLDRLLKDRERIQEQIKREQAKERTDNHKKDTRRKILVGALIINECEQDEELAKRVYQLLNEKLTKPRDRELFEIPPHPPFEGGGKG